jgi:hypothetical protein
VNPDGDAVDGSPKKPTDLALLEPRSSRWVRRARARWKVLERDLGVVGLALARTAAVGFAGLMVWLVASTLLGIVPAFADLQAWLGQPIPQLGVIFWRAVALMLMLGWTAGKIYVFAVGGVLGLRIGLGEVLLPAFRTQDERMQVAHVQAEPVVLRGRPGMGVYMTLQAGGMAGGEAVDLVARLKDHQGAYLLAALSAFRGPRGELVVRRDWRVPAGAVGADGDPEEVGLFLPLLAVETDARRALDGTVEVLLFSEGTYLAEGEAAFRVRLDDPAFQGLDLLPEGPARPLEEELAVLAEQVLAAEAHCQVCGDLLGEEDPGLVSCTRCGTPSHGECWDFVGQCSTFACEGSARPGLGEPRDADAPAPSAPAPPQALADVRRATDVPSLPVEVEVAAAGVQVPRQPRTPWELRPVALLYAASLTLLPLGAATVLAALAPGLFMLLVFAVAAFALAIPRGAMELLLLPGALARPVLARAFPAPGTRDLSHYVRVRRVELSARAEDDGGGARLEGMVLARGLEHFRLDFTLRLRGPTGYLCSPRSDLTGVYGELRAQLSSAPLDGDVAAPLEFWVELPGDALAMEPGRPVHVAYELLVSCDGEVLSEADGLGTFRPGDARGAGDSGTAFPEPRDARDRLGRNAFCGLCADPVPAQVVTCRACEHRGHPGCWEFLSVCPACGSPDGV